MKRMTKPIIEISRVDKYYSQDKRVLKNVSISIEQGEFITVIGPSGCGKTTLLRMINGLTDYSSGSIRVMGKDLEQWDLVDLRRRIGYVVQQGALFPHLNVSENMAFVLKLAQKDSLYTKQRIEELATLMGFDSNQLDAYPAELSGGQQQRVGLARALAANPSIVLLDEPLGALDNITRRGLQIELSRMHKELGVTFVMVTHDLFEAFRLGSRVVIMNEGEIVQDGSPKDIITNPANSWVKKFVEWEQLLA